MTNVRKEKVLKHLLLFLKKSNYLDDISNLSRLCTFFWQRNQKRIRSHQSHLAIDKCSLAQLGKGKSTRCCHTSLPPLSFVFKNSK